MVCCATASTPNGPSGWDAPSPAGGDPRAAHRRKGGTMNQHRGGSAALEPLVGEWTFEARRSAGRLGLVVGRSVGRWGVLKVLAIPEELPQAKERTSHSKSEVTRGACRP
jgi:hypothetical protein